MVPLDKTIERKWMKIWEERKIFEPEPEPGRTKSFVTVPFPYMNGPLHVGHAFTTTRVDAYARFKRMQGLNTLFPWAWHWTGQPLVAAAARLSKKDPAMVREFVELEKVPLQDIPKFYDPVFMARYYTDDGRECLKRLGISIDWRREFHTTDLEPAFNRFVLWQMAKLREKGYITKGTHPVVWCPRDQSPTGDHDRLSGEGVTWEEFTLILFPLSSGEITKFPAATLRPETIFGATNLWINPDAWYVEIVVNERDHWIVSKRAALKLGEQQKKINVEREFLGREFVGARVRHPLDYAQTLLILPAQFVDPDNGTGIVYSVPAHAPADYVALRDIQNDASRQSEFNLSQNDMASIKPISLISIPGMGEFPAKEIVEQMNIHDQKDPKVEEATAEIYRKEFHQGVMNSNTGVYQGKKVSEAKPLIAQELKQRGCADFLYELPERVVCRCTTECIVKVLEDQWFLKYSDPEWKKLAHECIDRASIYPENARQWFHDVIDWVRDWPCARRVGLGTPLPWSPGWIVETLSDSTIYMAFYTIVLAVRKNNIGSESLTEALLSYVFLGEGDPVQISKETGLDGKIIESMRQEFLYWYPVNLRNSAKELIPNHLTFFVFQHVAFFPRELWPTAISANGMLAHEGAKMSKSKGNVITVRQALDRYGADVVRANVLGGAEGMDDLDWREKTVVDLEAKIESIQNFILYLGERRGSGSKEGYGTEEFWLESQIQRRISSVIENLDQMKTKSAFYDSFYGYWNDIRYYLKRAESPSGLLLWDAAQIWIRLLSPFIPFTCEELNSRLGGSNLISLSWFPSPDKTKINIGAELGEQMIQNLIEDAENITKLLPVKPKTLYLYIAPKWTNDLLRLVIESRDSGAKTSDTLGRFFASIPDVPRKEIANLFPKITKEINELGDSFISNFMAIGCKIDEQGVYEESLSYLKRELGVEISIHAAEDRAEQYDPKNKARFALPFKPALYFE